MSEQAAIPIIDGGALAGPDGAARREADDFVELACHESGFMIVADPPGTARIEGDDRRRLLSFFDLDDESKQGLCRQRYVTANRNRYRGLAPMLPAQGIVTENLDIGPDAVARGGRGAQGDVLCEESPWPPEASLPGWRARVALAFAGFESLGCHVVSSIERVLDLEPGRLVRHFEQGNSTLKLTRHPEPGEWDDRLCEKLAIGQDAEHARLMQLILPHEDSGCVTFVNQDDGGGLEARAADGTWLRVPNESGWLAVNFGKLLEHWTGGAVRATQHRVIGTARRRTSIPFFFEPAVSARIEPLFGDRAFEPFLYGDYVWDRIQMFPDYQGLGPRFSSSTAAGA